MIIVIEVIKLCPPYMSRQNGSVAVANKLRQIQTWFRHNKLGICNALWVCQPLSDCFT